MICGVILYNFYKNKQLRKKMNIKSVSSKKIKQPMMMHQIHIQFTAPFTSYIYIYNYYIENKDKHPINMSKELVDLMNRKKMVKSNGRISVDGAYISDTFGTFAIDQCVFTPNNNEMHVDIKLNLNLKVPELTLEQAEELIWTILPATYSEEYDYTFKKCGIKTTKHFGVHFTDTPRNIEWVVV